MGKIALLSFIVAVVGLASYFAARSPAGSPAFWALAAGPTVLLALVAAWREQQDGTLGALLRPRGGDITVGVLSAALLLAVAYAFTRIVLPPESPRIAWIVRIYGQLGNTDVLRAHMGRVLAGVVVLAAAEELLWRGYATTLLAELVGSRRAWILSAVLYGLSKVPTMFPLADAVAGPNPLLPFAALVCGLAWGGMTRRFGRLPPAIVSHAAFVWSVLVMWRLWGKSV